MAKKNINLGKLGSKREVIKQGDESKNMDEEKIIEKIHNPKSGEKEEITRITVDLPASLHTQMKMRLFSRRMTIRKYIVDLIEKDLSNQ